MISHTTHGFRKLYAELPDNIKKQAKEAFNRFKKNPYYPGLVFKRVHSSKPIYSVRISRDYRAVGILLGDEIIWFWIGSHSDYDKLLTKMRNK